MLKRSKAYNSPAVYKLIAQFEAVLRLSQLLALYCADSFCAWPWLTTGKANNIRHEHSLNS